MPNFPFFGGRPSEDAIQDSEKQSSKVAQPRRTMHMVQHSDDSGHDGTTVSVDLPVSKSAVSQLCEPAFTALLLDFDPDGTQCIGSMGLDSNSDVDSFLDSVSETGVHYIIFSRAEIVMSLLLLFKVDSVFTPDQKDRLRRFLFGEHA